MNKYQEALDRIKNKIAIIDGEKMTIGQAYSQTFPILQELVDKEKPMKVKHIVENGWHKYVCGSCDGELELRHCYCPECGQELDWSDIDD